MIPYVSIIEIDIGTVSIKVWGLFVALGVILALKMTLRRARRTDISEYMVWNLLTFSLFGMILGGRMWHFITAPEEGVSLFGLDGGFSLAGGLAAAGIMSFAYLRSTKRDFLAVLDLLAPGAILALLMTRIGCFLVNDHVGRITALPWGMPFPDGSVRHPVALYEIIFLSMVYLLIRRKERGEKCDGVVSITFAMLYAIFRIFADSLRCSDMPSCDVRLGGLTASQWFFLASIFLLIGLAFWAVPGNLHDKASGKNRG